jgi:hypothetical protein
MPCITPLMDIPDEFRPVIIDCFPKLVALLMDSDSYVCGVGADALAKLSEKGNKYSIYHSAHEDFR